MNGMSTVEKSMEKAKFYNREDLKAKDVNGSMIISPSEEIAAAKWLSLAISMPT